MAIGISVPPPQLPRLRLPWRYAGTVFARQTLVLKTGILRVLSVTRVLWKRLVNAAQDILNPRARARQRQLAHLTVFEQQYEGLVDLLCAAAHEGIRPDRERAYARSRTWMFAHYPCVLAHVRPHWQEDQLNRSDPFLALFTHKSLIDAVNTDTGIEDLMRCRAALESYRATLDASPK